MLWKYIKAYSLRLCILSQQRPTETSKFPDEFSLQRKVWARSSVRLERRTLKPEDGEEIRRPRVQFPSGPPKFYSSQDGNFRVYEEYPGEKQLTLIAVIVAIYIFGPRISKTASLAKLLKGVQRRCAVGRFALENLIVIVLS